MSDQLARFPRNVDEVRVHLIAIRAFAAQGEDAVARVCRDGLYRDVLEAIAAGSCADPAGCAAEALKAGLIVSRVEVTT